MAIELRKRFIFKIIPMLNPDGVVIGNQRCNLIGSDINRNFSNPKKSVYPVPYAIREMI